MRHHVSRTVALGATRRWVETVVIGLSLCPWARPVMDREALRFVYSGAADADRLLASVRCELDVLGEALSGRMLAEVGDDVAAPETTIIVAPDAFADDFVALNEFVQMDCQEYLRAQGLDEAFQVVAFHPQFRFADEDADDPSNFVNRSPFTTLHLLPQDAVTAAIEAAPELAERLPQINQESLRSLGLRRVSQMVRDTAVMDDVDPGTQSSQ